MNKIQYVTGDLLNADEFFIVHGCNAMGAYASGVAGLIRKKWPEAYNAYMTEYEINGLDVGKCIPVYVDNGHKLVINAITQKYYGRDAVNGTVYVDYDGLRTCFYNINYIIQDYNPYMSDPRVAMPLIGAGLAGGDWEIISQIITEEARTYIPVVYVLDDFIPSIFKIS